MGEAGCKPLYFDYCSPYDAVWTRCRIPWRSVRSPPRNGCWTLDRTWSVRPASVDHVVWRAAAPGAESASRRARAAARAVVRGRAPTAVERRARTTTSGKPRTGRTRRHRRPPPDLAYIDRYCRRPRAIRRVMCPSVDKSSVLSAVYAEQGLCNCRASVRPSVCLSVLFGRRCCKFAAAGPAAGDMDRLLHGRRSAAAAPQSQRSAQQQMRAAPFTDYTTLRL